VIQRPLHCGKVVHVVGKPLLFQLPIKEIDSSPYYCASLNSRLVLVDANNFVFACSKLGDGCWAMVTKTCFPLSTRMPLIF
jgi:hypothetical protein